MRVTAHAARVARGPLTPLEYEAPPLGPDEVDVAVRGVDRKWLLKDVTTLIAQEDAHVADIRSELNADGRVQLRMRLRVGDYGQLSTLLGKLDALPGVERAWRAG